MKLSIGWRVLNWLLAGLTLFLASKGRNPYLIALRGAELPLVLALGALGFCAAICLATKGRLGRVEASLLAASAVLAGGIGLCGEYHFQRQRTQVLTADWATKVLGRHFIVGYSDFDEVSRLAENGLIGGIYLGRKNAHGKSGQQLHAEIDALQRVRANAGLPPLFVAADQEGGRVAHLSPPLEVLPSLSTLVSSGDDLTLEARARAYGARQGRSLSLLGINLNFGPVVDLRPSDGGPRFDTHTLIGKRAISSNPDTVARVALAYGRGLMSEGVRPTLKHFPGLGQVSVDTHHFAGRITRTREELNNSDWKPFRLLANEGSAIMLGHVVVEALDPVYPASLSKSVVQTLFRKEWGFRGLLITDDLNMGAVSSFGVCHAAVAALRAGVDLVLVSYDPDQFYPAMACAAEALRTGQLDSKLLVESLLRIATSRPEVKERRLISAISFRGSKG